MDQQIIEPTNKNNRIIFTVLIVLVTAGVIGGVVYYTLNKEIQNQNKKIEELQKKNEEKALLKAPELTKEEDDVINKEKKDVATDWKNGSYKQISFRYPKNWIIEKEDPLNLKTDIVKTNTINNEKHYLYVTFSEFEYDGKGLEPAIEKLATTGQGFTLSNKSEIEVNGTKAFRYDTECCGSKKDSIFLNANGKLYEVSSSIGGALDQTDLNNFKKTLEVIMSTVKF